MQLKQTITGLGSGLVIAVVLGGCAWSGPRQQAYSACMDYWFAEEMGPKGPKMEVFPVGEEKVDYCLKYARQVVTGPVAATGREMGLGR